MKKLFSYALLVALFVSCKQKPAAEYEKVSTDPIFYHDTMEKITEVIIHDIFTPPVASRIYGYATLAGYEAMLPKFPEYKTVAGKFKGLEALPQPEKGEMYSYELASIKATLFVAKKLTFTIQKYDELEKAIDQKFQDAGVPSDVFERSVKYGELIGEKVIEYSKKDNYPQTRGLRYSVKNEPGKWVPTPPQYGDAIEPYWSTIRPSLMDSASQFPPPPAILYDKNKSSEFWKEVMEVYETGKNLTEDQKTQAWFWDDNAFVMNVQGHVMFANKKMTPGGHWLAITKTACKQAKADFAKTVYSYFLVSTALHEGFISCWYEKFKSEKIRPETVINAELDSKWLPFLQTPPFPEYTSGHSTISAASAEALTSIYGDNFVFTDSTEHKFGHGVRTFESFRKAAIECSFSRMYGGIHYRSGCVEGQKAGTRIGEFVVKRIKE